MFAEHRVHFFYFPLFFNAKNGMNSKRNLTTAFKLLGKNAVRLRHRNGPIRNLDDYHRRFAQQKNPSDQTNYTHRHAQN